MWICISGILFIALLAQGLFIIRVKAVASAKIASNNEAMQEATDQLNAYFRTTEARR